MARLIKEVTTSYIPGDPGHPAVPPTLAHAGYWGYVTTTICPTGSIVVRQVDLYPGQNLFELLGYPSGTTSVEGMSIIGVAPVDTNGDGVEDYSRVTVSITGSSPCYDVSTLTYFPPVAASPGTPAAAPTPAQINVSYNIGWNSYASAIDSLPLGSYFEFSVALGTQAALVAVGYEGLEGYPIDFFTNGVMVDVSGIHVFESGVSVATLGANTATAKIRIVRLIDGSIMYGLDTGQFYVSAADPLSTAVDLTVYGMLYHGLDEISSAEFIVGGSYSAPEATLSGVGSLIAETSTSAPLTGVGTLSAAAPSSCSMSGVGTLFATVGDGATAYGTLPFVYALGGDTEYAIGYGTLPAISITAVTTSYAPPAITSGYGNLPFLTGYAHGDDIGIGTGDADLPYLVGLSGDYDYGFGSGTLPLMSSLGFGGMYPADTVAFISSATVSRSFSAARDLVLVFTSGGVLESAYAMTREVALSLLTGMIADTPQSMLGVYGYSLISEATGLSLQSLSAQDRPDLNTSGVVWVVNRETNSSTQYEQFGFNSFFQRDNDYYGVANDGIYLLDGDTDAGFPINALAEMGRTNLGYTAEKRVHQVLLGVGSDSELYLKVDVDEQTYVYSMRSAGTAVRTRPVDIGWGVKGDYWDFTLLNPNGVDFELASVSFYPVPLARRG